MSQENNNRDKNPSLINMSSSSLISCFELAEANFEKTDQENNVLITGFRDIDDITGGLEPGDLVLVTGSEGSAPASFSLDLALNHLFFCKDIGRTLVIEAKKTEELLMKTCISKLGGIHINKLTCWTLNEEEFVRLSSVGRMLKDNIFQVGARPSLSIGLIEQMIEEAKQAFESEETSYNHDKPILVLIDDIDCIKTESDYPDARFNHIGRELKRIALEHKVVLILPTSNVDKQHINRTDKRPMKMDVDSKCGPLTNYIDECWGIYNDSYFNEFSPDVDVVELISLKSRHFQHWKVKLAFDEVHGRKHKDLPLYNEELVKPSKDDEPS